MRANQPKALAMSTTTATATATATAAAVWGYDCGGSHYWAKAQSTVVVHRQKYLTEMTIAYQTNRRPGSGWTGPQPEEFFSTVYQYSELLVNDNDTEVK